MRIIIKILKKVSQNNVTPFGLCIKKAPAIVPVNEDFHIKWQKILKSAEKELIELLLLESETIIAKIQFEVDSSVNALFPKDQEEVRQHLKEKNRKLKEKLKKRREKKWKKFTNRPNYGYYSPKVDPPHQQVLASSPKEVIAAKIHQAYIEMLQPARIKERKKVTQRSLKTKYRKEKETKKRLLLSTIKMMRNRKT